MDAASPGGAAARAAVGESPRASPGPVADRAATSERRRRGGGGPPAASPAAAAAAAAGAPSPQAEGFVPHAAAARASGGGRGAKAHREVECIDLSSDESPRSERGGGAAQQRLRLPAATTQPAEVVMDCFSPSPVRHFFAAGLSQYVL